VLRLLEWLAFWTTQLCGKFYRGIFILVPNFMPIFIIHTVVNGEGLWQIQTPEHFPLGG
jgi:hypothetical protein